MPPKVRRKHVPAGRGIAQCREEGRLERADGVCVRQQLVADLGMVDNGSISPKELHLIPFIGRSRCLVGRHIVAPTAG